MSHTWDLDIKQKEREWQEQHGGELQKLAYNRPGTQVVLHTQFDRILRALQIQPNMRLLDIGCGVGHLLSWFAKQMNAEYHGIDLSINSVKVARTINSSFKLTVGDAELLPFRNKSFQRVSCNGAAHHFINLRFTLGEIYRILMPGGILVMYEPVATMISNFVRGLFLQNSKYESPADLACKQEFTSMRIKTILAEVGFSDVSTCFYDFLAYPLTGMYMELPLSKSSSTMAFLTRIESKLERWSIVKPFFDLFAWRILITARKPL